MKKQSEEKSKETGHYTRVDDHTGEVFTVDPEFVLMSRRPGIGKDWFDLYYKDAYPSDYITLRGIKMRPPKFYDKEFEKIDEEDLLTEIKEKRSEYAKKFYLDNTPDRLLVRENVTKDKINSYLKRPEQ